MEKSLFSELKRIGIDEELAVSVSASLDPDHNASKKDVLVMQEAIMQIQLQSERSYLALKSDITDLRSEVRTEISGLRSEMRTEITGLRSEMRTEITGLRSEMQTEISGLRSEMHKETGSIRSELGNMHRQYWITFGGLITTIISVFVVNWYFHL
ncbi:gp58-like family protein [Endozoicomonas gorgoniicola]|uniref:Gp58-like family protein n=1 Tax=Endozoicomonas gorgoniicola TaxID=1234144 RepID=A0ABT3MZS0_9GAMM|nr:gp58-like family protein [Endozoicomonas gorgoniicola]MCW7554489.1 gp58-like family protein [Endozoicomonas gorgoniicola]